MLAVVHQSDSSEWTRFILAKSCFGRMTTLGQDYDSVVVLMAPITRSADDRGDVAPVTLSRKSLESQLPTPHREAESKCGAVDNSSNCLGKRIRITGWNQESRDTVDYRLGVAQRCRCDDRPRA
jgi:hypothetical protein